MLANYIVLNCIHRVLTILCDFHIVRAPVSLSNI